MSAKRFNTFVLVASAETSTAVTYATVLPVGVSIKQLLSVWMNGKSFVMMNGTQVDATELGLCSSEDPSVAVLKVLLGVDIVNAVRLQILPNSYEFVKVEWADQILLRT